jgi:hypothetical protein
MTGGDGLPTEADCRSCHDDLIEFPFLNETNVNKYHLLVLADSPIILPTARPVRSPVKPTDVSSVILSSGILKLTVARFRVSRTV